MASSKYQALKTRHQREEDIKVDTQILTMKNNKCKVKEFTRHGRNTGEETPLQRIKLLTPLWIKLTSFKNMPLSTAQLDIELFGK